MEKSKAKKGLPVFIGVAAVWMGTHFGPGVASGTQLNQYYVRFGLPGIFVTIIAMGFLGYALYCSMEFSRIYKAYDYQSWVVKLFGNTNMSSSSSTFPSSSRYSQRPAAA